ncbi:acyltransferase family protein [bacterium]|nr:acyltransferase family protein [bacterium]
MISNINTTRSSRIHAFDSLRAIMMLLGLVVHSAITYGVYEDLGSWPIRDSVTHLSNDFIVVLIHSFRMQIFFLVSGFFGSMLFYDKNPLAMIKNRISRIILPFIVFIILLWPAIVFGFGYSMLIFSGETNPIQLIAAFFSGFDMLIPKFTFHLWFLYYLTLITTSTIILALLLAKTPKILRYINTTFKSIIQQSLVRILIFSIITATIYYIIGTWSVPTSISLVPDINMFLYYSSFYIIGWILYKSKSLLDSFTKYDLFITSLAIILFTFYFFMSESFTFVSHVILKSIIVWLLVFGITGLFIRYTSEYSAIMKYLSDASYWVYLVHMPFTAIIPGFISDWSAHATFKFLFVFLVTSLICFLSYHFLVRGTFIGEFLNGRKYSRKLYKKLI